MRATVGRHAGRVYWLVSMANLLMRHVADCSPKYMLRPAQSVAQKPSLDELVAQVPHALYDLRYHPYYNAPLNVRANGEPIVDPYCFQPSGLFSHPRNCGLFISCSQGRGCIMECPATLHFSPQHKICMFPAQASCSLDNSIDTSKWPLPRYCKDIVASQTGLSRPHHHHRPTVVPVTRPPVSYPPSVTPRPPHPLFTTPCTCPSKITESSSSSGALIGKPGGHLSGQSNKPTAAGSQPIQGSNGLGETSSGGKLGSEEVGVGNTDGNKPSAGTASSKPSSSSNQGTSNEQNSSEIPSGPGKQPVSGGMQNGSAVVTPGYPSNSSGQSSSSLPIGIGGNPLGSSGIVGTPVGTFPTTGGSGDTSHAEGKPDKIGSGAQISGQTEIQPGASKPDGVSSPTGSPTGGYPTPGGTVSKPGESGSSSIKPLPINSSASEGNFPATDGPSVVSPSVGDSSKEKPDGKQPDAQVSVQAGTQPDTSKPIGVSLPIGTPVDGYPIPGETGIKPGKPLPTNSTVGAVDFPVPGGSGSGSPDSSQEKPDETQPSGQTEAKPVNVPGGSYPIPGESVGSGGVIGSLPSSSVSPGGASSVPVGSPADTESTLPEIIELPASGEQSQGSGCIGANCCLQLVKDIATHPRLYNIIRNYYLTLSPDSTYGGSKKGSLATSFQNYERVSQHNKPIKPFDKLYSNINFNYNNEYAQDFNEVGDWYPHSTNNAPDNYNLQVLSQNNQNLDGYQPSLDLNQQSNRRRPYDLEGWLNHYIADDHLQNPSFKYKTDSDAQLKAWGRRQDHQNPHLNYYQQLRQDDHQYQQFHHPQFTLHNQILPTEQRHYLQPY